MHKMNPRDLADRFTHDVDQLLQEAGLPDGPILSDEYQQDLNLARQLMETDYSQASKKRLTLRRQLLNQIKNNQLTTADIPGPGGRLKYWLNRWWQIFVASPLPLNPLRESNVSSRSISGSWRLTPIVATLFLLLGFSLFMLIGYSNNGQTILATLGQYASTMPRQFESQWQFRGKSGISTAPVVADGLIFVGSNDGELYALEADSGAEVWQFTVGLPLDITPTVVEQTLYIGSKQGQFYALESLTGQLKWQRNLHLSAPVLVTTQAVYLGDEAGYFYALDAQTGQELWRFKTNGTISVKATVHDKTLYLGSRDRHLYALDLATGAERWRFVVDDWVTAAPQVADNTVYFGSSDQYMYAVDAVTGQERWRFNGGDDIFAGPTLVHNVVYFGSYDGHLYAIEAETAQLHWRVNTGVPVQSSPYVIGQTVYFGGGDGQLYAVDAITGQILDTFTADSQIYQAVTVVDDLIYLVSGKGTLQAINYGWDFSPLFNQLGQKTVDLSHDPNKPLGFQFVPSAWYVVGQDEDIHFRGRIVDGAGQPANGFQIQADNGSQQWLSNPSGQIRSDGEWEIVIKDAAQQAGWWWLTVGQTNCSMESIQFNTCQNFTRLSESVKTEIKYPNETIINADWACHRDCESK